MSPPSPKKLPLWFFLLAISSACSAKDTIDSTNSNLEVHNNVKSEISLRPWETKGLGKVIGTETLTVIKTKGGRGEVVVLRWSENQSEFKTEVYRGDVEADKHSSWSLVNGGNEQKTLSHQHGDLYMISQLIAGKNGGQKTQVFNLSR